MPIDTHATLFVPCLIDAIYPEVGQAVVNVLENIGVTVGYAEGQTCCGQPAFNAGHRTAARNAAEHFLSVFKGADCIVCPSGSCVHMVRHHYPQLFEAGSSLHEQTRRLGQRTYEFTEYLVDVLQIDDIETTFKGRVTYHDSCHLLRGLGIDEQPRKLLRRVRGLEFVEMYNSDRCCGFGGSFMVKYTDISTAMVDDKIDNIVASGADTVVGCDVGCLMNIEGRLHHRGLAVKTMHIAQVLDGCNR